jgi:hypothetical protein
VRPTFVFSECPLLGLEEEKEGSGSAGMTMGASGALVLLVALVGRLVGRLAGMVVGRLDCRANILRTVGENGGGAN